MTGLKYLVNSRWLKSGLNQASKSNLKILEASWAPKGTGRKSYLDEHIPTARFIDMWLGVNSLPTLSRPFPHLNTFVQQLEKEGVTDSSHVILYDKGGPVMFSARLWLQCREIGLQKVSVLDGGFVSWKAEGFPITSGEPGQTPDGNITVRRKKIFIDLKDMTSVLTETNNQIVDTRESGHFRGELPEPSPYTKLALETAGFEAPESLHKGHFPGAKSIPFKTLRDSESGCFKNKEQLKSQFEKAGIEIDSPTVGTCYNGLTACMIPLVAGILGANPDNFKIYTGSWTEFGQKGNNDLLQRENK